MAEARAHRITVDPRPNGGDLDVEGYTLALLTDLIDVLSRDADLMDRLVSLVDSPPAAPDRYRPETLPTEQLVADLAKRLPTSIRLHLPEMTVLAMRLRATAVAQSDIARAALTVAGSEQQDRRRTA